MRWFWDSDTPACEHQDFTVPPVRALLEHTLTFCLVRRGNHAPTSLHQLQGLGHAALALGHVDLQCAHLESAALRYQEAIDYYRAAADSAEIDALSSLANVERLLGNLTQAEADSRMALEKYRLSEDNFGTIVALAELGHIYLDAGRLDQAAQALIEALDLARGAEDEEGEGMPAWGWPRSICASTALSRRCLKHRRPGGLYRGQR